MTQRVALVTGAAGGQGWAIAKRLRAKGYSVAACDRRVDEVVSAVAELADDQVIAVELDVTSPEQWTTAVRQVVDRFGSLSTLVNNAGVLHRASLTDETPEDFENAWRVNCLGVFLGMRATLDQLRAAEHAAIVNICSTGAIRPFPQHAAYGSSKWALRGLTQAAAAELGPSASTRCSPGRSPPRCSTRPPRHDWPPPPCSAASASPAKSPMP
jgi:3alpha(or 20beta)-hydroxysteroid dehydrogenase